MDWIDKVLKKGLKKGSRKVERVALAARMVKGLKEVSEKGLKKGPKEGCGRGGGLKMRGIWGGIGERVQEAR
jgi:hypothetical protein